MVRRAAGRQGRRLRARARCTRTSECRRPSGSDRCRPCKSSRPCTLAECFPSIFRAELLRAYSSGCPHMPPGGTARRRIWAWGDCCSKVGTVHSRSPFRLSVTYPIVNQYAIWSSQERGTVIDALLNRGCHAKVAEEWRAGGV